LDRLQVSAHALLRPRSGLASVPKIEYEARIADYVTAEPGRRNSAVTQKLLNVP
jgi:hypothetical protein